MNDKAQISGGHFWAMSVVYLAAGTWLFLPTVSIESSGRGAWITTLAAGVVGTGTAILVGALSARFPGLTVVGYAGRIAGRWTGKLIGLVMGVYIALDAAVDLRVAMKSLMGVLFLTTPTYVVGMLLVLTALPLAWNGAVRASRMGPILLIALFLVLTLSLPSLWKHVEWGYLIPVWDPSEFRVAERPFWVTLLAIRSGWLAVIIPYVAQPKKALGRYLWALWVAVGISLVAVVLPVVVFSPEGARHISQPFPYVTSVVRYPNFPLERLEMLTRLAFNLLALYAVAIRHFCAALLFSEVFETKTVRPFYLATAILLSILPVTFISGEQQGETFAGWSVVVNGLLTWVIFLLLWAVYLLRGMFRQQSGKAAGSAG